MTHLSNTPRLPDEGAGFYTDFPTPPMGNSAGRDTSSSRPGSRASMVFPTLCDTPEPEHYGWLDDGLNRAERWADYIIPVVQIGLVVLLVVTLTVHFFDVWDAATVHPDPVTQHD
ncbi:hypothetical protein [Roseovarius sp.]|uniref:hypothetical protein n=1 Tax=Roseovarius sp. TaxID=1486281 RepID=UPI003BAD46B9